MAREMFGEFVLTKILLQQLKNSFIVLIIIKLLSLMIIQLGMVMLILNLLINFVHDYIYITARP